MSKKIFRAIEPEWGSNEPLMIIPRVVKVHGEGFGYEYNKVILQPVEVEIVEDEKVNISNDTKTNMAKKKRTKEDYPIVKYRIVNGNGYVLCEGEEELKEKLKRANDFYESLKAINDYDCERFKVQYVIKVTEEYIELPCQCLESKSESYDTGK